MTRERIAETVERLVREVSGWDHVTTGEHRFGGTEFRLGPREFGHVHAWGMLGVPYVRGLRDERVAEGRTGIHHLLTESGWTTFHVESPDDYDRAVATPPVVPLAGGDAEADARGPR